MLQKVIDRFKRQRTEAFLRRTYGRRYAFVGMGQHSLTNLYPVLHYLGVPLKYICVTNAEKAALISRKYLGTQGTTDLDAVLDDPEVAGVFVAASPRAHFALAQRVVAAGKHLFIEKPPCLTTDELSTLQQAAEKGTGAVVVGLQKRYAPAVRILGKRLRQEHGAVSYDLHYQTGAYPEGDALTDLFIHPLYLAVHLFGPATVLSAQRPTKSSFLLMLKHGDAVGTLELSTDYTWTSAHESLHVVTPSALYDLDNLDTLTCRPKQSTLFGVPMEKVHPAVPAVQHLYGRNTFNPVPQNNTLVAQGFYDELLAFTELCEGRPADNLTPLSSLTDTFRLMGALRSV